MTRDKRNFAAACTEMLLHRSSQSARCQLARIGELSRSNGAPLLPKGKGKRLPEAETRGVT